MLDTADESLVNQPVADAEIGARTPTERRPRLLPGGPVDLPGRGTTFARDSGPVARRPDAPVVLLLHGWGATADLNWFQAYRRLASRYRVVALDHRGHGRGIRPLDGIVELDDCADDAVALLDVLGIDQAVVAGYSMGGAVAQLAWHRHRERVAGLVLCSTARHFQGGPVSDLWYRSYTPLAHVAHAASGPAQALVRWRVDQRVQGDQQADWLRSELLRASPAGLLSAMRSVGRFRSNAWIGDVDVPASVVITTKDRTVPSRNQRALAAAISGATTHEVVGPHDAIASQAGTYLPALLAAFDDVTSRMVEHRPLAKAAR